MADYPVPGGGWDAGQARRYISDSGWLPLIGSLTDLTGLGCVCL